MTKPVVKLEVVLGIVKDKNKILLSIRRESKLKTAHLKVEIPGGKPKIGEEFSKTARREIREETGWIVKVIRKLPLVYTHDWEYPDKIQHTIIHCFECQPIRKSKLKRKMHADAVWYEIKETKKLDLMPGVEEFIDIVSS